MMMHIRQGRGYGAVMRPVDEGLVVECQLCDWSSSSSPIERETEDELFYEWADHRRRDHGCTS